MTHFIPLQTCPLCGTDLADQPGRPNRGRLVEDTAPPAKKTILCEAVSESKWCGQCKQMVSSVSERALPGSDIGLNTLIEMAWLWVMRALSFPRIRDYFIGFKTLRLSTAGLSRIMIRLSNILQPLYAEILNDVRQGAKIWADETGWRVKGKLWWLWIFANERSAYYWADASRGGGVVQVILGEGFFGLLIVDGWHAYTQKFSATSRPAWRIFSARYGPSSSRLSQYRSIMTFYLKLRRIIRDGEKLQSQRSELAEFALSFGD